MTGTPGKRKTRATSSRISESQIGVSSSAPSWVARATLGTGSHLSAGDPRRWGDFLSCVCAAGWTAVPSSIIPNPPTAAVNTMDNPIRTRLCVEIKTHVGHEEASCYLELKGGDWVSGGMVLHVHLPGCCCSLNRLQQDSPHNKRLKKKETKDGF